MKKVFAFYIILILFSFGFVSAVWYNPFSWFEKKPLDYNKLINQIEDDSDQIKSIVKSPISVTSSNPWEMGGTTCSEFDSNICTGPYDIDNYGGGYCYNFNLESFGASFIVPTYIGWSCGDYDSNPEDFEWGTPFPVLIDCDSDGAFSAMGADFGAVSGVCVFTSAEDCDDFNENLSVWMDCYPDGDSDTYTVAGPPHRICTNGTLPLGCASAHSSVLDCDDGNSNVNPGQSENCFINTGDEDCDWNATSLSFMRLPDCGDSDCDLQDCETNKKCCGGNCASTFEVDFTGSGGQCKICSSGSITNKANGISSCTDTNGNSIVYNPSIQEIGCCGGSCGILQRYYWSDDGDSYPDETNYEDVCSFEELSHDNNFSDSTQQADNWYNGGPFDCDDTDPNIIGPGNDDDGDGDDSDRCDDDGDGKWDASIGGDDCNDNNSAIFFGATEICTDKIDNNCNDFFGNFDFDFGSGIDCADNVSCSGQTCSEPVGELENCTDGVDSDICQCCEGECRELIKMYADCDGDTWGDNLNTQDFCPNNLNENSKIGGCNITYRQGDCDDNNDTVIPGTSKPGFPCMICDNNMSNYPSSLSGVYRIAYEWNNNLCGGLYYNSTLDGGHEEHEMICCNGACIQDDTLPYCQNCASDEFGPPVFNVTNFNPNDWRVGNNPWVNSISLATACYVCELNETAGTFVGGALDRTTIISLNSSGEPKDTDYKCCGGNSYDSTNKGCCSPSGSKTGSPFDIIPPYSTKCCEEQDIKAVIAEVTIGGWKIKNPFTGNTLYTIPKIWETTTGITKPFVGKDFEINKTGNYVVVQRNDPDYCLGNGYNSGSKVTDELTTKGIHFNGVCEPCAGSKRLNTVLGTALDNANIATSYIGALAAIGISSGSEFLANYYYVNFSDNEESWWNLKHFPRYNRVCYYSKKNIPLIGPWTPWTNVTKCGECDPKDNDDKDVEVTIKYPNISVSGGLSGGWPFINLGISFNWTTKNIIFHNRSLSDQCNLHHIGNGDITKMLSADKSWVGGGFISYDTEALSKGCYYCNPEGGCEVQSHLLPGWVAYVTKKAIIALSYAQMVYGTLQLLDDVEPDPKKICAACPSGQWLCVPWPGCGCCDILSEPATGDMDLLACTHVSSGNVQKGVVTDTNPSCTGDLTGIAALGFA